MISNVTSYVKTRREVTVTLGDGSKLKWDSGSPEKCYYFNSFNTLSLDVDDIDKFCEGLQELKARIGESEDGWKVS